MELTACEACLPLSVVVGGIRERRWRHLAKEGRVLEPKRKASLRKAMGEAEAGKLGKGEKMGE